MFNNAMTQSLIPAFSQLLTPEKRAEFEALYSRGIRLSVILVLPMMAVMFALAKPFFSVWAGAEFGESSTAPFYILLVGIFFNVFAFVPHTAITSFGRTDLFAKLHWAELLFYAVLLVPCITYFGIVGAALAWSLRVVIDAGIVVWLSNRVVAVRLGSTSQFVSIISAALALFLPLMFGVYFVFPIWAIAIIAMVSLAAYCILIFGTAIDADEKRWAIEVIKARFGRVGQFV
jgi:O-antigen/teichoic acid export membrane protein